MNQKKDILMLDIVGKERINSTLKKQLFFRKEKLAKERINSTLKSEYRAAKSQIKRANETAKNCYKSYLNGKRVMNTGFNYSETGSRFKLN